MTEVTPRWKTSHVRSCSKPMCSDDRPCNSCRGKANQANGRKAQRIAARKLGIRPRFRSQLSNEESFGGPWRTEIKSGQQVNALAGTYLKAEGQSGASQAIGDVRPFRCVAMPEGWGSEGLVIVRLSVWCRYVEPTVWGEGA